MTSEAPAPQDQAGRITLVTGASRGIGRAVALELARRGGDLIVSARTKGALEELDDEVRALGRSAALVPLDLKDYDGVDRLASVIAQRWGRLDGLALVGATLGPQSPMRDVEPRDWDDTIAVDLTANFRLLRALDPLLRASPAARVAVVTSDAALRPRAFLAAYAAAKAGLESLARSYAAEVGALGVKVNIIDPGATRTRMRALARPAEDPSTLPPPERPARVIADALSPAETRTGARILVREIAPA
jgi:NAD(P)-dependent dehydrogenase (short-subunit alcohol dehydrogenase family)